MIKACGDGGQHVVQGGEEPVVRRQAAGQLPDSLNGGQLRTVRRQEQQGEHGRMFLKQRFEQNRVVVSGIVQHHARATRTMPHQHIQKGLERGTQRADELAGAQADGPKTGHRLAWWGHGTEPDP